MREDDSGPLEELVTDTVVLVELALEVTWETEVEEEVVNWGVLLLVSAVDEEFALLVVMVVDSEV